ncbi:high mobility group box domain-containing protein, partial [Mycena rebaudengoi]
MSSSSAPNTEPPTVQPPRPPNAWILYLSDKCQELKERGEGRAFATQSKEIGAMWQCESVAVRELYAARAKEAARQHKLQYPDYRFHPVKKAAK